MDWEPYDPEWLIAVVRDAAEEDDRWLLDALPACTRAARTSDPEARAEYHYFVNPTHANQPGAAWQHVETVCLGTPDADVNIDVLRGRRVGGVEILPYTWPSTRRG